MRSGNFHLMSYYFLFCQSLNYLDIQILTYATIQLVCVIIDSELRELAADARDIVWFIEVFHFSLKLILR